MEEDDFISSHRKARRHGKEWSAGVYSADSELSSKKSRCPKETNTVTGQVLATEYSYNLF